MAKILVKIKKEGFIPIIRVRGPKDEKFVNEKLLEQALRKGLLGEDDYEVIEKEEVEEVEVQEEQAAETEEVEVQEEDEEFELTEENVNKIKTKKEAQEVLEALEIEYSKKSTLKDMKSLIIENME